MFLRRCAATSCFLILGTVLAVSQGTRASAQHGRVDEPDKDQPERRAQWFMHGRVVPEESAALLRQRAHQQKMRLRGMRAARDANIDLSSGLQADATSGWKSLGPSPLASDATGFGGQDYGWVSGRATAVAIDPADPSGNTVYLGGAYGGVWKSTNAGAG